MRINLENSNIHLSILLAVIATHSQNIARALHTSWFIKNIEMASPQYRNTQYANVISRFVRHINQSNQYLFTPPLYLSESPSLNHPFAPTSNYRLHTLSFARQYSCTVNIKLRRFVPSAEKCMIATAVRLDLVFYPIHMWVRNAFSFILLNCV